MARRDTSPDFIEALARGLDVIRAFQPRHPVMTLAAVAAAAGPGPADGPPHPADAGAARLRAASGRRRLTSSRPRVLELGMAYVLSRGLWEVARPHMEALVGADARVVLDRAAGRLRHRLRRPGGRAEDHRAGGVDRDPVPGDADLARQGPAGGAAARARPSGVLAEPSRSGITARWQPDAAERAAELREVRARGWSLTDEQLALGIRSVAAPLRDGDGRVIAAMNVTVHAAETPSTC